jgi:hypothetical protein
VKTQSLIHCLGLEVNGDLDGLTIYTRRDGKVVSYYASPALKPPSPAQRTQRDRFAIAYHSWRDLDPAAKQALTDATNACSLTMTGLNLWICLCLQPDESLYHTICAQTRLPLPRPQLLP